ncbi:2-oxo-4-hydroxy-4-carboxy-5-ureidoimidazoline decarboxylase [Streptomyces sp. JNUCC 64]
MPTASPGTVADPGRHRPTGPAVHTPPAHQGATLPSYGSLRPPGRAALPPRQRTPATAGPAALPSALGWLNAAAPDAALAALLGCCGSHRWAARLAAHRPYPDLGALLAAADEAAFDLTPADLAEALARETPTEPTGSGRPGYSAARTALSAAHAAYESRFGHAFLLCLDGCPPDEALDRVLTAIRARLGNDREDERALTADELRRIARGRLTRLAPAPPLGPRPR